MANGFQGSDEVMRNIKKLTGKDAISSFKSAARHSMKPVLDDAVRRAQAIDSADSPAKIADNIAMKVIAKKNGDVVAAIGVRGGARYRRGDKSAGLTTHWRYVELGTEHSPPIPFLRPALESNQSSVLGHFTKALRDAIFRKLK